MCKKITCCCLWTLWERKDDPDGECMLLGPLCCCLVDCCGGAPECLCCGGAGGKCCPDGMSPSDKPFKTGDGGGGGDVSNKKGAYFG